MIRIYEECRKVQTLKEFNESAYVATGIMTGKEYRRKRRKEARK